MIPNPDSKTNPQHQPETEWIGDIQTFTSVALLPKEAGERERLGRPARDQNKESDQQKPPKAK